VRRFSNGDETDRFHEGWLPWPERNPVVLVTGQTTSPVNSDLIFTTRRFSSRCKVIKS